MSDDLSVKFAQNSASFSIDLYSALSSGNAGKNIIFSPFSIQTCVALAFAGAEGETAEEMASGLKLVSNDRDLVGESFKSVLDSYSNSTLLKIANKIYVKEGYEINPEFNAIAKKSFHSESEAINFEANAAAADTINNWVEDKTNKKIQKLISPDSLDSLTRLVLINAIHFKGEWAKKFKKESTAEDDFYLNENDKVKVEFMNGKLNLKYGYFDELDCTAIDMPYSNSDLSMLVLLPNSRTGLKDLEEKLKSVNLHDLVKEMSNEEVIVKFPKFKVEFSTELTEPLKKLGIKKMFTDNAEFGKLLSAPENLKVSKVIHKAVIEVNEEGTEAAAATACIARTKRSLDVNSPKKLNADHPFIYALIDGRPIKRSIIFYGAFVHPDIFVKKVHEDL